MSKTIAKSHAKTSAALRAANPGAGSNASASGPGGDRSNPFYTAEEILPYLTEEEKASLRQEVLTTINNELVHPEDLEVAVPRLLRSCATEAKELRRSMTTISSSQIVEAQRALQIVQDSGKQVEDLRLIFMKQGELIQGFGADTRSYKQLRQLHFLRDNVGAVIGWSLALKEVRYDNLFVLVQQRHFASMYKRLRRLQKIRKTVITKAGAQYRSYQAIFEPYFSKLDAVLSMFINEIYTTLTEDTMNVAIQKALDDNPDDGHGGGGGQPGAGNDPFPEFTALKECIAVCGEEVESPVLNFGSDGVEQEAPITTDLIHDAVAKNVGKCWEDEIMVDVVDPFGQISIYLEQMKKVEPLLEALEMTLIPLSTKFSFFGVVVQAVHGEVMHVMEGYVDPDAEVEANGLMEASQFIQWYKEMITSNGYAQYVDASTIDDMAAAFMTAAVGGLTAHLTRLCRACAITVCNDPKGPTILPSGYPVTTGPMDMFTVLQQTLGGLTAALDMSVMRQIGKACADAIYAYLDECRQRSDFDYWDDDNASLATPLTEGDWQQRRMMMLYAFVNDCTTVETNLDTVELRFASCWEFDIGGVGEDGAVGDDHRGAGDDFSVTPFQRVQDALPDNVFYFLDEITAQVERVVGAQWATVFRAGPWYEDDDNPLLLIVNTISEYVEEEFSVMLQEQRLRKITRQMLIRFVQKYISTLLEFLGDVIRNPKKNAVDDWNSFLDCVSRDIELAVTMWTQHNAEGQGQLLALARKALELMKDLLAVKKAVDFGYILQEKLLDDFGDCPTFVIRFALEARPKDVDRETRERMLAIWEERTAYQHRDKHTDLPTTGWSQAPSFYGSIDRSIADLEHATGFFSKSVKKKREAEKKRKAAEEKEAKRAARKARREADSAASKVRGPKRVPKATQQQSVEVAALSEILNSLAVSTHPVAPVLMRLSSVNAAAAMSPHLVDVAVNLTDCVFRGVDWSGKQLHEDDFDLMIKRAEDNNVKQMIITGTNLLQCEKAVALCRRYPERKLLCTVGVHPADSCEFARPPPDAAAVEAFVANDASGVQRSSNSKALITPEEESANAAARLERLVRLIEENRDVVVAVGEIGVDYAELLLCPRETQEKYFVAQMRAFAPLGLPFFFHSRECGMRFYELLEAEALANPHMRTAVDVAADVPPQLHGVVHSFNGSQEEQDRLLAMGLYLSLNGSAFRTREMTKQVLKIPRNRLMLETDAPWCDIRRQDYGYAFVKTHFDTVKRKKPFVLGKCLERRNEPCHLIQVVEAYLGCLHAENAESATAEAESGGTSVTKETLTRELYNNCKSVFGI